jgi:hypothetical protein
MVYLMILSVTKFMEANNAIIGCRRTVNDGRIPVCVRV